MSLLTPHFITQFATEVRTDYQNFGMLKTDMFNSKQGKFERFRFFKQGLASSFQHNPGSELPTKMIDKSNLEVVVTWYDATDVLDITHDDMTPYDAKQLAVNSIKTAIARRQDATIFEMLKNTSMLANNIIPKTITGAAAPLSLKAIQAAAMVLDSNFVPPTDRYMIVHPNQLHALMNNTQVSSFDWNTSKVLMNGTMDSFYGFKFIQMPQFMVDQASGFSSGIKEDVATELNTYFFHGGNAGAIALAINNAGGMAPRIDYESSRAGYRAFAQIGLGAGIIDLNSVGKIIGAKA